jgi:hypothetical protein
MARVLLLLAAVLQSVVIFSFADGGDAAFLNENINRKITLASPHGLENMLTFKVTKKDAAATSYVIPLRNESQAGRISWFSCKVNNEVAKDVQLDTSGGKINLKVSLPREFTSGSISCQM